MPGFAPLYLPFSSTTVPFTSTYLIPSDGIDGSPNVARACHQKKEKFMLRWAAIFLIIASIAALFGFGGIAGTAAGIAKTLFFIFIAICVILFIAGLFAGRRM